MSNVVELETDQKEVDETVNTASNLEHTTKESEMQKALTATMKRAYVLGISAGMKTMCNIVIETMSKNKNLNPQRQLSVLRQVVLGHASKQDELEKKQKEAQTVNRSTQNDNTNSSDTKEDDNESVSE